MMRTRCTWLVALAIGATGCDLTYEPDVGLLDEPDYGVDASPGGDGAPAVGGPCGDGDPSTPVSFATQIRPLLGRSPGSCNGCHGPSAASGFSVTSYETLRRGGHVSSEQIVVPGAPCESVLYQKLSPAPPFGARMPYNGPPFYTAEDRALVRDWIAEGALNN